jgi:hypothetical protein
MRNVTLGLCLFGICASVIVLASCGSGTPLGPPGTVHQSSARPMPGSGENLIYATTGASKVYVFAYSTGERVGTLTGFSEAGIPCTDKAGDVFFPDFFARQIVEYAHGGTSPISTLSDGGYEPDGCAVDPKSGDLAVGNYASVDSKPSSVAIYRNARGTPVLYPVPADTAAETCAYDNHGSLFVSASSPTNQTFALLELPHGGSSLSAISVDRQITGGGAIQWDGSYLAIGDPRYRGRGSSTIDRVEVTGSAGTVVGTITLSNPQKREPYTGVGFWIKDHTIVQPDLRSDSGIEYWKYPAGGMATKTIKAKIPGLFGVTVSVAPRR